MTPNFERMRERLRSFDLAGLLVEELGWNHHRGAMSPISVSGQIFRLVPIAEKADFVVWQCEAEDGRIPSHPIRRQIETRSQRAHFEHLIVFVDEARSEQVWQWVKRRKGKPDASREYTYRAGQTGELVLQRLYNLAFGLEEEEGLTISVVEERVRRALDADKLTKRFYDRYQKELCAFQGFVEGLGGVTEAGWYASLMLNRLMFIYFIQKRGFLDGDTGYLRNRLRLVREARGPDQFHGFYRSFLRRLFHEGLGMPEAERSPELAELLGKVPFLNGGIFDVHDLERDNPDIKIPDEAFERLFAFFDQYAWHLDERPYAKDNEINPDVLGHIFEKSINQKEKGAYYTKEDVTGYMAENTIIPRLLDMAAGAHPDLQDDLLSLLATDPDRYIRPSVGHGMAWDARDASSPVRVDPPQDLPENVRAGVSDPAKRANWDESASKRKGQPSALAHRRETWRQVLARRKRYQEVRERLASGRIRGASDLVTLNLDARRLTLDAIARSSPELTQAMWSAATSITVLDPTCGSGAFLFAALRTLEPVYAACLARMRGSPYPADDKVIADVDRHPSERYFILKSIVLKNLYGVDIMKEAAEICKLRLFLKLVAQLESYDQIEPLPDIDFNIRSGNALVGFSSVEEINKAFKGDMVKALSLPDIVARTKKADAAFERFQSIQTEAGADASTIREGKRDLRRRVVELRDELDRHLAFEYGIASHRSARFERWRSTHQPFHWCAEFYGVVERRRGFDVVIGNPPYVAMAKAKRQYAPSGDFITIKCPNVYGPVVERSMAVMRQDARLGLILPLNFAFSQKYATVRATVVAQSATCWFSSFGRIPSALFSADVRVRNTIVVAHKSGAGSEVVRSKYFTTRLHRWFEDERPTLFGLLSYVEYSPSAFEGLVPKIGSPRLLAALQGWRRDSYRLGHDVLQSGSDHVLYYKQSAYNWMTFCVDKPPVIGPKGEKLEQTKYGRVGYFADGATRDLAMTILNGRLAFLWWVAMGDDFDVSKSDYESAPFGPGQVTGQRRQELERIVPVLRETMGEKLTKKSNAKKVIYNYNLALCRDVTDRSDKILLDALGAADLWDDIELEYSLVVRTKYDSESAPHPR